MQPAGSQPELRVVTPVDGTAMFPERSSACAEGRPPTRGLRFAKAYFTTFLVVASYAWLKLQARFRSQAAIERKLARAHLRNARRIERTIVTLQGLFIKVGQLISIMTNFLPPAFRKQLEGLQDQVPPRPYDDIEARLREEFSGPGPQELFAEFDRRPIASASIGQVHVARTHDGRRVAVKVQYPDIEEIVRIDLRTLKRIFGILSYFLPHHGLDGVYSEIRDMILQELDFRTEAKNMARIGKNFVSRADVSFPLVVPELSGARVLTTTFEAGARIGDLNRLDEQKINRKELAQLVVEAYCQQIFVDGVYHADPHPGNILVRSCDPSAGGGTPCIVFLDFGAVAEISPNMRQGIVEFLQGALQGDTQRIVRSMKKMGFIARGADDRVFDQIVEYFHQQFQNEVHLDSFNLKDLKFDPQKGLENLADLRRMNISLRELTESFHVPKEWILLERTLLLLMGLCTELDPDMNPMAVIRPYLERFVLGPDQDWSTFVVGTGKELVLSALALPAELRRFVGRAQRGELALSVHNVDSAARLLYGLGHQIIYTAVGIAAGAIAVVFEGRHAWESARIAWAIAGGAGVLLLASMWSTRARLRRRLRR